MNKSTPFWLSVRELAAMRDHIPAERREMSGVRDAARLDVPPNAAASRADGTRQQHVAVDLATKSDASS